MAHLYVNSLTLKLLCKYKSFLYFFDKIYFFIYNTLQLNEGINMLFDKTLDKSLFLILEYDEENRQSIINLLNSLPEELYSDVQEDFNKKIRFFTKKEYYKDNMKYIVKYFPDSYRLTILEQIKLHNEYYNVKELMLTDLFYYIGSYKQGSKNSIINCETYNYEYYKMPIIDIFTKRKEEEDIQVKLCKPFTKKLSLKYDFNEK